MSCRVQLADSNNAESKSLAHSCQYLWMFEELAISSIEGHWPIPPVTIVAVDMFASSMTTVNKIELLQIYISILDTLNSMCAKNICSIFI